MPYGRIRKASAGRISLPPGVGTCSIINKDDVTSGDDSSNVPDGHHGSGDLGEGHGGSIDDRASDIAQAEMMNAQRYFVPLKGDLRPKGSSNSLHVYSLEDAQGQGAHKADVAGNAHSVNSSLGSGQIMAASPAIPIIHSMPLSNPARTISADGQPPSLPPALKVAGSYEDTDGKTSVLAKAIDLLDVEDGSDDEVLPEAFSDDDAGQPGEEDDGDMIFGMDDSQERFSPSMKFGTGTSTGPSSQSGSRPSLAGNSPLRGGARPPPCDRTASPALNRSNADIIEAHRKSPKFSLLQSCLIWRLVWFLMNVVYLEEDGKVVHAVESGRVIAMRTGTLSSILWTSLIVMKAQTAAKLQLRLSKAQ